MKNLKRLLCLAISMILILCSGCGELFNNCLDAAIDRSNAKENKELNKIAASFVPEVTGYELTVKEVDDFSSEEEYRNQGYFTTDDTHEILTVRTDDALIIDPLNFEVVTSEGEQLIFSKSITVKQESIIGFEFFERLWRGVLIFYDNKVFFIHLGHDREPIHDPPVAAALYLVDFENEKLLYCDYAEERYLEDFDPFIQNVYKISKKD